MSSFAARADERELLDGDDYTEEEYETTLKEIELINRLTFGYRPTLNALKEIAIKHPGRRLRILDVGFGYGDTLRAIQRWAKESGVDVDLTGVDLNPRARILAQKVSSPDIRFVTADIFNWPGEGEFDVVINALFMHHLNDQEVLRVISWMTENAKLAWFINDLHRHPIAFHFIRVATKLGGFSRLIKNDASLSVARAFSEQDWHGYLEESGLKHGATVRWYLPFRYGILWETA